MNISWYLNRLKTMSFPELFYRFNQVAKTKKHKYLSKGKKIKYLKYKGSNPILDQSAINEEASKFMFDKNFPIFDLSVDIEQIPNWHLDLNSKNEFPLDFSRDINTRTHPNRSAKFAWEINRLQYLSFIALAYRKNTEPKYLDLFIDHVSSWIENNPYLTGLNWYSNIELNVRLLTWFLCSEILQADKLIKTNEKFKKFTEELWLPTIYQHCSHTVKNLSKFSSSNNHLISEYAGVFVAASYWNFKESSKWIKRTKIGLEEEIVKQHTADGINREQTSEYMQFITDYFLISLVVAENTDNKFSENYYKTFGNIVDYMYQMMDSKGNVPKYGDEDDGRTFILDTEENFNNFKSILTSGVVLFGNGKWKNKSDGIDTKNTLLFGKKGQQRFNEVQSIEEKPESKFYTESGYYFFKDQKEGNEIFAYFDAAPLGYLSIAAHGHADALSFLLHLNGQPFLVDPGTYVYHTEREFRDYFKGTIAHNTIRINEDNQATIGGPTMWRDHYKIDVLEESTNKRNDKVEAKHNGYAKKYGISHIRSVDFDKEKSVFTITDKIESSDSDKEYTLELPFHLHPDIQVFKDKGIFELKANEKVGYSVRMTTDASLNYEVTKGQKDPLLGWYSDSFNLLEPTNALYAIKTHKGNATFTTEIEILFDK